MLFRKKQAVILKDMGEYQQKHVIQNAEIIRQDFQKICRETQVREMSNIKPQLFQDTQLKIRKFIIRVRNKYLHGANKTIS